MRYFAYTSVLTFFTLLCLSSLLYAQLPVVHTLLPEQNITSRTMVLADTSNTLTITEVSKPGLLSRFEQHRAEAFNFNQTKTNYWLRIAIQSDSTVLGKQYFVQLSYPLIDEVDFFYQDSAAGWHCYQAGDMRPFSVRKVKHRTALFPVRIWHTGEQIFYIRLNSETTTNTRLHLLEAEHFFVRLQLEEVGYGIFFGVLILIALNNLFYFFAIRDPGYLAYILFVIANLIFQASLSGHVFQYFLTDLAGWQNRWIAVFTTSGILLGVIFALIFLDIKRYSALTYRFTMGLLVFQMGMLLLSVFMDYASVMPVIKALSMISVLILVILAVRVWQRGNKAARFYVIAYVFYLTFASAFILKTSNLLPETFITVHGFEIAILMECITLSIALADKTRLERDRSNAEKKEAQQEALRIQQEANTTLEQKVQQRTSELNLTVEELHQTLHLANRRKAEIEDKNKDITASLNYAKRIQEASLTSEAQRQLLLPDSFVIFKPRDIVGGDFYCMEQVDGVKVLIVADCTGHGVPGGFMSMLGINLFREMVVARRLTDPAAILEAMNEGIGKALRQQESQNRDGMDAAICTIDESARQLHFSGARIPIYLLQEGHELQTLRPDRFSLGGSGRSEKQIFHTSTLPLVPGLTQFLICTDGLQDQFGGVSGRKFLAKQIRELYSTCRMLPVQAQRQRFEQTLADWMGSHRQIDDILIVGGMIASR